MKKSPRHRLEINGWDQIKSLIQSRALFVFGINRLLICYSWILLMTGAVNSRTERKKANYNFISAQKNLSAHGRGAVRLRKRNKNTLISHGGEEGKKSIFYRVYLLGVLVNILILLTKVASLRD